MLRGKWVLMNILGVVPPEPPANVPLLRESDKMANGQPCRSKSPCASGCRSTAPARRAPAATR